MKKILGPVVDESRRMSNLNKVKSYFSLILPRRIKTDDRIQIIARLQNKPKLFRLLLAVKSTNDKASKNEPQMIAFELKAVFQNDLSLMRCTTNWKTDSGWQDEKLVQQTDWIDSKGLINITLQFDKTSLDVFDNTNSLITKFDLNYEYSKINRLQLWGDILKLKSISLKYDKNSRPSSRTRN